MVEAAYLFQLLIVVQGFEMEILDQECDERDNDEIFWEPQLRSMH